MLHEGAGVRSKRFGGEGTGEWQAVTQEKFMASHADWEARDSINAWSAGDGFFLATGGDTQRVTELTALLKAEKVPMTAPCDWPATVWESSAGAVAR